jgi:hypothetical protein
VTWREAALQAIKAMQIAAATANLTVVLPTISNPK